MREISQRYNAYIDLLANEKKFKYTFTKKQLISQLIYKLRQKINKIEFKLLDFCK